MWQDDAADAKWFSLHDIPPLAFDHKLVVRTGLESLLRQDEVGNKGGLGPATQLLHGQ